MPKSASPTALSITDLKDPSSFREIGLLEHDDLLPFIQEQYQNKTPMLRAYVWVNILLLGGLLAWGAYVLIQTEYRFGTILTGMSMGILVSFSLLIVLHEWIHGLTYQWMGAPKITYGGNWKKFYFYAAADRYIVNDRQFRIIALAPFVVINTCLLIGLFWANIPMSFFFLSVLLLHTAMCGGDFGMLNFLLLNQARPVYTYDDIEQKKSWFYEKIGENPH